MVDANKMWIWAKDAFIGVFFFYYFMLFIIIVLVVVCISQM